jgi:hypothetical protein
MRTDTGTLLTCPAWIVEDPRLSHGALRLWLCLALRASEGEAQTEPSLTGLGAQLGSTLRSVSRWRDELILCGALRLEETDEGVSWQLIISHPAGIDRVEVQMALTDGASTPSDQDEHIYIYNKYNNVPVPNITVPYTPISTESLGAGFDEFWHLYPRKTDKRRARGLWVKGKLAAEKLRVIEGLEGWLRVWELEKTQSKFIPYPSTFLNARRWEAVPEPTPELSRPTSTMIASTARFLDRHRGDK